MLRYRLKSMDLKITELADYLQISRPTMYKFIEAYDAKNFDLINKKVLKLFNYINENELVGKKNVVNYILTKLADIIKIIKKYIISNPESKKSQFIVKCATESEFDDIISYLIKVYPLINKKGLSVDEENLLNPYNEFKNKILDKGEY